MYYLENQGFEDFRDFARAVHKEIVQFDNENVDEYDRTWFLINARKEVQRRRQHIMSTDIANRDRLFDQCQQLEIALESWEDSWSGGKLSNIQRTYLICALIEQQKGDPQKFTNQEAGEILQRKKYLGNTSKPDDQFRYQVRKGKELLNQGIVPPPSIQKAADEAIQDLLTPS